ncbi:MAG: fibronectin type III domain-containing protein [Vicinamibacterales bacterium]
MIRRRAVRLLAGALAVCLAASCGKKGPPLPPLRPLPGRIADATARRIDDRVELRFTVPAANADGSTPPVAERVEIYGMSAPAGTPAPPMTKLVAPPNLKTGIAVRRPPPAGKEVPAADRDKPLPGEVSTFTEAVASSEHGATAPTRYYVVVAVSGRDHRGASSPVLNVPLSTDVDAPTDASLTYDEHAFTLTWTSPKDGLAFRVYEADRDGRPSATPVSGAAPLKDAAFSTPLVFGQTRCFVVRAVSVAGPVALEGPPGPPACETPEDTFPPVPPADLRAIPEDGAVTLSWTAVAGDDVAGYVVLRGEGSGDRLLPLMTAPVAATTFKDTTVERGRTYVYAVVAVDASPRQNRSAESNRQTVTVR